jgi:hypothetical protein
MSADLARGERQTMAGKRRPMAGNLTVSGRPVIGSRALAGLACQARTAGTPSLRAARNATRSCSGVTAMPVRSLWSGAIHEASSSIEVYWPSRAARARNFPHPHQREHTRVRDDFS